MPEYRSTLRQVIGDSLATADLSSTNWLTATQAGIAIDPPVLPANVRVFGMPLAPPQVALFKPSTGAMSWIVDGQMVADAYIRLVWGTNSLVIVRPTSRTATFNATDQAFGWTATHRLTNRNFPFYFRQLPTGERFGIQIGFTPPINLPAFSYEYLFVPGPGVDRIRLYRFVTDSFGRHSEPDIDVAITVTPSTNFSASAGSWISFLSGGVRRSEFWFDELAAKTQSTYWKVEQVTINGISTLCFIIGFRFLGLASGTPFMNDGYIGPGATDGTVDHNANALSSVRVQNTVGTGTITEIGLNVSAFEVGNLQLGIYADTSSLPAALLLNCGNVAAAAGWCTISGISQAVTLNLYYWLTFINQAWIRYSSLSTATGKRRWTGTSYPTLPDPFGSADDNQAGAYFRAYVTLGGAVESGAAAMTALGLFTTIPRWKRGGTFAVTGAGILAAAGGRRRLADFAVTGLGLLTGVGQRLTKGVLAITGAGLLESIGRRNRFGAMGLTGVGNLTGAGYRTISASIAAIGAGTISIVGTVSGLLSGAAAMVGQGLATFAGGCVRSTNVAITGVGNLTAIGMRGIIGSMAIVGQGLLTGAGGAVRGAASAFTGIGELVASGTVTAVGVIIEWGTSIITGIGDFTISGRRAVSGATSIVGVGLLTTAGSIFEALKIIALTVSLYARNFIGKLYTRTGITKFYSRAAELEYGQSITTLFPWTFPITFASNATVKMKDRTTTVKMKVK